MVEKPGHQPPSRVADCCQAGLFTATILVSAFLLFWVQPLFAKMILPILGGSSSVWTTSMLFFQFTLLAGYLYAHFSSRLLAAGPQILLHLILLGAAFLSLPFYIDSTNAETPAGSPVFWVLSFAALTVGLPFFMVSATAPLLQRWFSLTRHKDRDNPYFLYAASNLGSMAALFCFPLIFEPSFGVHLQTIYWRTAYGVLAALFLASGIVTFTNLDFENTKKSPAKDQALPASESDRISTASRLSWVFLAFVPSSMMLGLTSHVTTDITPIAMFWIVPLAIYLLSFVLVFSRYRHLIGDKGLAAIIILCTSALILMKFAGFVKTADAAMISIALHTTLFFATAWLLHGYLSSSRPRAAHLTEFYLWLSIGGMLGGMFNAVVAPIIFNQVYEYYAIILPVYFFAMKVLVEKKSAGAAACQSGATINLATLFGMFVVLLLVADTIMSRPITATVRWTFVAGSTASVVIAGIAALYALGRLPRHLVFYVIVLAVLCNALVLYSTHTNLLLTRSFYGSLKVKVKHDSDGVPYHLFIHGSTQHNLQRVAADARERTEPLLYYHRQANLTHAIRAIQSHQSHQHRPLHLGVVGLGAGATSAYLEEGDTATFYEIDPEVVAMAKNRNYFTFLDDARGQTEIIVGDARLQLQKAGNDSFDILLIDAFSSDSVPVHLLTAEAVEMYLHKLKDDGVLIFHLSNRYLDLKKVMQGYRLPDGSAIYYASKRGVEKPADSAKLSVGLFSHSRVALIAKESALPEEITLSTRWLKLEHDPDFTTWTDDFSNVLGVLKF
ncbi:MAG: hypothetical protein ACD_75C02615G0005 [uncultured bacterium]|nr:MAG: hypothetical protein ACD_75C02615G0005 [uncultured bacterium]